MRELAQRDRDAYAKPNLGFTQAGTERLTHEIMKGDYVCLESGRVEVRQVVADDVERELRQAWDTLIEDRSRYPQLERYVSASSEVVTAYKAQFLIGQRTLLDVLNAENELFAARGSLVSGKSAVSSGELRVLGAVGTLLETLRLPLPGKGQMINPERQ